MLVLLGINISFPIKFCFSVAPIFCPHSLKWVRFTEKGGLRGEVNLMLLGCRRECHPPWAVFNITIMDGATSGEVVTCNVLRLQSSQHSLLVKYWNNHYATIAMIA